MRPVMMRKAGIVMMVVDGAMVMMLNAMLVVNSQLGTPWCNVITAGHMTIGHVSLRDHATIGRTSKQERFSARRVLAGRGHVQRGNA